MTITYPLAAPSSPTPRRINYAPKFAVAKTESIFTFKTLVYEHIGQAWEIAVELPPMKADEAEAWVAWGLALNGTAGTFTFGDPTKESPRGTGGGNPVVDGDGQRRSKTLTTRGWTANETVLKAGDHFQIGNYLYAAMTDVTADSSGEATVDLFPRVRDVLVDGQAITVNSPKGLWRLGEPLSWDVSEAVVYGITFSAVEAL